MRVNTAAQIGVIGGGLGGLAAACTLAARGYRVALFEKNSFLGGKAALLEDQGFRFDMGPTILTMPSVLRRLFAEAGTRMEDHLELIRLDPQWRCFFDDHSVLDLRQDVEEMVAELRAFAPQTPSAEGYRSFLQLAGRLNNISQQFFFWKAVGSLWDMFNARAIFQPSLLSAVRDLGLGRSVASTVRRHVADPRLAQMLDHFTQYIGSAPDQSPAVLCGIAHMQTDEGIWYPRGGTAAIPRALEALARSLGVEVHCEVGVRRILLNARSEIVGLETDDGTSVKLDAIVANSDSVLTHRDLIRGDPARRFAARRDYEPACSGVVLYLGLDRGYEHLAHHNFVFSSDPEAEFESIYRRGEPAPDPTCYVAAPARTEPDVAPARGEALYVLVHTPYLRPHHDWRQLFPNYRQTILDKLARTANLLDLEGRIRFERWLTPADIQDRYGVPHGAIYGLASHGTFFGAFKPCNRSPDVAGLYLAGGSAHPGPGMPMVLMSGWIAADALDRDGRVKPRGNPVASRDYSYEGETQ